MATLRSGACEAQQYASFLEQQSWTSHSDASMTTPRCGCAAVAVDGHIIAIGGGNGNVDALLSVERSAVRHSKDDTSTLTLSPWSALPSAIIPRRWFGAAVVPPNFGVSDDSDSAKSNVLVAGGYTATYGSSACAEADLSTNKWRKLPSMGVKRGGCAVACDTSDGRVYVVGGWDGSKRFGSVECLSFSAQDGARGPLWTLLASHMKHPRSGCAAVVVEGRPVHPTAPSAPRQLVVMGGYTDNGLTNIVETYVFETGQWEELPPMKEKRRGCAAVAVGQCIYVVGGDNGKEILATAEYFDFRTRQWTLLPHAMSKHRWGCAAIVVDGHVVVLGGCDVSTNSKCVESLKIVVKDTAAHEIELPALPAPTNAVGAANRIQPLEQWCTIVGALLGKVEAEINERKEMMKKTREEKMEAAEDAYREEVKAAEERKRNKICDAEEENSVDMAALESTTDEWVRVTRHQLQEAQLEMEGLRLIANETDTRITNVSPSKLPSFAVTQRRFQVFIPDAEGDLVPLDIIQGDYAALKQLAAEELNVSPDVISKFRRKSDGVVVKSDRHMSSLKLDDELEVVTKNCAPAQTTNNVATRIVGGTNLNLNGSSDDVLQFRVVVKG